MSKRFLLKTPRPRYKLMRQYSTASINHYLTVTHYKKNQVILMYPNAKL